jgi:tetratricopeptide (TPR) repeat protein
MLGSAGFDMRARSEFPKAREAAERALEIDDRLGEAHANLGAIRLFYDWDFPGARRAYERALQLSPSDPAVLDGYAWYLLDVEGNVEEALDYSERLLRVAPLGVHYRAERFKHFFYARQYERALEEVERIRELDPSFVDIDIASCYQALGREEEAHRAHIAFNERCGKPCEPFLAASKRGWAEGGWEGSVRASLDLLTGIEWWSPSMIGLVYSGIGEVDEAFAWLERAYRQRDPHMTVLKSNPLYDPLRSDPRYHDLLRRIGFPEE